LIQIKKWLFNAFKNGAWKVGSLDRWLFRKSKGVARLKNSFIILLFCNDKEIYHEKKVTG